MAATLCGFAVAQTERPDVDWAKITQKLEAVQAAIQARDLEKTRKVADDLCIVAGTEWHKQLPTDAEYLERAEQRIAGNPQNRAPQLPHLAQLAFQAGEMEKAEQYARETLQNTTPQAVIGDSIHVGNIVLGLVVLKRGDVAAARAYLLASTKTKGNSSLNRWGPNLALAKELLDKGENEVVLEYLQSSKSFVTGNPKLDEWIATLKGGRAPDLSREYLWNH
jgi:ATP/maltotriose-dependent transcriptional regulator MalT